jgi:hypothetical protein
MPARSSVGQRRGAGADFALEGFQAADRADGDTARYSFNPFHADGFPAKRLQHKGKDGDRFQRFSCSVDSVRS